LDCARQIPLDEIFIVPVRLTPCRVPRSIQRELQYVDLFPDWIDGLARLVTTLRREVARAGGDAEVEEHRRAFAAIIQRESPGVFLSHLISPSRSARATAADRECTCSFS